jgi:ABC-2 type transport system ATP-binding protein
VKVPPELRARALEVLGAGEVGAAAGAGDHRGEVELSMPAGVAPETAAAQVLGRLLQAGVPVLGFTLEGGRLGDAFLAVTEDA